MTRSGIAPASADARRGVPPQRLGRVAAEFARDVRVGKGGEKGEIDRLAPRSAGSCRVAPARRRDRTHRAKPLRILARDEVAIRGRRHRLAQASTSAARARHAGRRARGRRDWRARWRRKPSRASSRSSAPSTAARFARKAAARSAAAASGAHSSTMPRLVFCPTAARVAVTALEHARARRGRRRARSPAR